MDKVSIFIGTYPEISVEFALLFFAFIFSSLYRMVRESYHTTIQKIGPLIQAIVGIVLFYFVLQFPFAKGTLTDDGQLGVGIIVFVYFALGYWLWDLDWIDLLW
jgi:hypothetical protein